MGLLHVSFIGWILLSDIQFTLAQHLTSDLEVGNFVCRHSRVTFTCETKGSASIVWRSPDYIEDQLEFSASFNRIGDTSSDQETIATLINEYNSEDGAQVLVSTLSIIVSPNPVESSVTCVHTDAPSTSTVNFKVLGKPDKPEGLFAIQLLQQNSYCVVHAIWHPVDDGESNMTHYQIFANKTIIMSNETVTVGSGNDTRIFSMFKVPICAPHMITVSASNNCGKSDMSSEYTVSRSIRDQVTLSSFSDECQGSFATNPDDTDGAETNKYSLVVIAFLVVVAPLPMLGI